MSECGGHPGSCGKPRGALYVEVGGGEPSVPASGPRTVPHMAAVPVFDFAAFFAALDSERCSRGLGWYDVADELWQQSAQLNAEREDHPI